MKRAQMMVDPCALSGHVLSDPLVLNLLEKFMSNKSFVAKSHFTDENLGLVTRRQILEGLSEQKQAELLSAKLIAPLLVESHGEVGPEGLALAGSESAEGLPIVEILKKVNSKSVKNS